MRLLRLHDEAPGGVVLEFHSNLTVVRGLHGVPRRRVLDALEAIHGGQRSGALQEFSGLIEVDGTQVELNPDSLAVLALTPDLGIAVGRAELELASLEPAQADEAVADPWRSPAEARRAKVDAEAALAVLRSSLGQLRERHREAAARRAELTQSPEGTMDRARGDATARTRGADAVPLAEAVRRGSGGATLMLEGPGPTPEAVAALASSAARLERLRTRRDETLAALAPLEKIDTGSVEAALSEARRLDRDERWPDPIAAGLADEFAAAMAALAQCDRRLEAAGLGPAAVSERLDSAQRRVAAAEEALRPASIDPDDARALEAAHEAVSAAETRLTAALIPGKALKKKLEDAVCEQQEILARMGFATYTAFVMSTTAPSVSPDLRAELERAQVEFVTAQAEYAQLRAAYANDPERSALVEALDSVRRRAHEHAGRVDDGDLVRVLRELTVVDEDHARAGARAAQALRMALEEVGVDFGDLDLRGDEVAEVATVWLADMADASARRPELESALRETEEEIVVAERALAQLEPTSSTVVVAETTASAAPAAPGPDGVDVPPDGAERDRRDQALLAAMVAEAELEAELEDQGVLEAAAVDAARGAADRLAVIELALAGDDTGASRHPGLERLDGYLLARLAAQQSGSLAGAVPLVLDEPLALLHDDEVVHLMGRLGKVSGMVQIIYVGDDARVVEWATEAGEDRARSLLVG